MVRNNKRNRLCRWDTLRGKFFDLAFRLKEVAGRKFWLDDAAKNNLHLTAPKHESQISFNATLRLESEARNTKHLIFCCLQSSVSVKTACKALHSRPELLLFFWPFCKCFILRDIRSEQEKMTDYTISNFNAYFWHRDTGSTIRSAGKFHQISFGIEKLQFPASQ